MEVIQLSDYRKQPQSPPPREKQRSQYDLYPMPFFNKKRHCTWDVTPTGDYGLDFNTGQAFAIEFLRSNDKTYGWASLMACIVSDMIRAGATGKYRDGSLKVNGIVVGFMAVIGGAVAHSRILDLICSQD
jgi:hypothetical protein